MPRLLLPNSTSTITTGADTSKDYKIHYMPISSLSSMCSMVFAPPLDVLKRQADAYGRGTVDRRSSRYWLILIELKLIFFQFYGDSKARFVSDIKDVSVLAAADSRNSVKILHADKRSWLIEFETVRDAKRFEFVVVESQKSLQNRSQFIKSDRAESRLRPFG